VHRLGAGGAAIILAGEPSAIERGLTHYWGGVGLQWPLRWKRRSRANPSLTWHNPAPPNKALFRGVMDVNKRVRRRFWLVSGAISFTALPLLLWLFPL
jgi:hypothetical protein